MLDHSFQLRASSARFVKLFLFFFSSKLQSLLPTLHVFYQAISKLFQAFTQEIRGSPEHI